MAVARQGCGLNLGDQIVADVKDVERRRGEMFGNVVEGACAQGVESDLGVFLCHRADHDHWARKLSHDEAQGLRVHSDRASPYRD